MDDNVARADAPPPVIPCLEIRALQHDRGIAFRMVMPWQETGRADVLGCDGRGSHDPGYR